MTTKLSWSTEQRVVNELIPYEKNPRTLSSKQLGELKKSLKRFNLVEIPAIDRDNRVIAGHQRLKVLKLLGRGTETIDVRVPNRTLSETEYRQYLISSNAVTGDWDFELLKDFDFDFLVDAGFDALTLESAWDIQRSVSDEAFDPERELKKIKSTDIKLGDLLILGDHRLLCADATDKQAVKRLFGDERTSMIYSDPPYNINLDYDKGVGLRASYGGFVNDNKSPQAYKAFIRETLEAALSVATDDAHIFYWCDEAWVWVFQTLYMDMSIRNRRLNIWLKNSANPTPAVAFNKATEICVYGTKGKPYLCPTLTNVSEVMNADAVIGNELINIWAENRLSGSKYEHPTAKPPSLHERAIKRCTKPNDIILDSFSGSASTLLAAEALGRCVYSLENNPIFCELARRQFESVSSKPVELIRDYYESGA